MQHPIIKINDRTGLLVSANPNKNTANYDFVIISEGWKITYFDVPWAEVEILREAN